jgi:hypothetical protein
MKILIASMIALGLGAAPGLAIADAPPVPASVQPFLDGSEDFVHTATGAFGAKDTTVVVWFDIRGAGTFEGFALIPDARAPHGTRKQALPRLPGGSIDGGLRIPLVANLDKDADDELVIELHVQRSVSDPSGQYGGYSYGSVEYAVLDWTGKAFVRVTGLEQKLAAKMKARTQDRNTALSDADLRAALGLPTS